MDIYGHLQEFGKMYKDDRHEKFALLLLACKDQTHPG